VDESKHLLTNALRSITGKDPLLFNRLNNPSARVQLGQRCTVGLCGIGDCKFATRAVGVGVSDLDLDLDFLEALLPVLFQWTVRMSSWGADVTIDGPTLGTPGRGEGISVHNGVPRHIPHTFGSISSFALLRSILLQQLRAVRLRSNAYVAKRARVHRVEFDNIVVGPSCLAARGDICTATNSYDGRAPVRTAQEKRRRKERARVMVVNTTSR